MDNNEIGKASELGIEPISYLLRKYSIPAIIAMTVNALYNIVDRMFIGNAPHLGANGLAAITVSFPAMIISLALGILIGQGGSVLYSINLGEGKAHEADRILGNSVALMVALGLILTISGEIFLEKILIASGASNTILPYGKSYLRIIFIGVTFQILSVGLNNFLRADGKPNLSMLSVAAGAITNVILDAIFIFGFNMGMEGAALATIISQFLSMIICVYQFTCKKTVHKIRLKYAKIEKKLSITIFKLGLPGFLLQAAFSLLTVIFNHYLLIYGGDIAVSGMGVVSSIQNLMVLPIIGLNQGLKPILGFNYGATKYERVHHSVILSIKIATIMAIIGFAVVHIFPTQIVSMFNRDSSLLEFGTTALKDWTLCFPVVGFQIIASNFFQAIGKPKRAIFLSMSRQILILIPAIMISAKYWHLDGILHAQAFADGTSSILTAVFFFKFMRELKLLEAAV